MFDFIKERRAVAALDAVAQRLPRTLSTCTGVERCAAKGLANAYLLAGAADYGNDFSHAPMKLRPETVYDAVANLSDQHRRKLDAADSLSGRPAVDPGFSAWKWEMLAIELVIVTAGCSIHGDARTAAGETWNALKKVGLHVDEAVKAMQNYARIYAINPVPAVGSKKIDRAWLVSLTSHMPPMYRRKK
ncbi:hypothetical protein G6L37_03040 [Agrobacterium rubi]|nr:hypothetical protein [Agrobacterium rubi]NTF24351.1 hypothetical protein [Agrobacterium rubi]